MPTSGPQVDSTLETQSPTESLEGSLGGSPQETTFDTDHGKPVPVPEDTRDEGEKKETGFLENIFGQPKEPEAADQVKKVSTVDETQKRETEHHLNNVVQSFITN